MNMKHGQDSIRTFEALFREYYPRLYYYALDWVEEEEAAKAKKNDPVKFTLKPVADRLNQLLDNKVTFAADTVGPDAQAKVAALKEGECVLLENTRFTAGEEGRDLEFCKKLASFCDIYVNDAFGTAHRSHASTAAIVEYGLVKTAVCGFLIQKELEVMGDSLDHPVHPFVAVLGGAKVADKLNVISNLLTKCDTLIIGGGMAYTFLKAEGYEVGKSLVDDEKIGYCKDMIQKAKDTGKQLLPHDFRRCISSRTYRRECSQSLHLLVHPFRYFHLFIWIFLFLARFRRRNHCFEIVQFFGLLDLLLLSNYLKSTGFIIATWVVVIHKDWLISKPNIFSPKRKRRLQTRT